MSNEGSHYIAKTPNAKTRVCLCCDEEFQSSWRGHRICPACTKLNDDHPDRLSRKNYKGRETNNHVLTGGLTSDEGFPDGFVKAARSELVQWKGENE